MFDACCNERIPQFNDSGSDEEDVWEEKELTFESIAENKIRWAYKNLLLLVCSCYIVFYWYQIIIFSNG